MCIDVFQRCVCLEGRQSRGGFNFILLFFLSGRRRRRSPAGVSLNLSYRCGFRGGRVKVGVYHYLNTAGRKDRPSVCQFSV